ncbi:sensor histidine kinase [Anoxybacterium hadale]|uniref:Sensor histidine kinase n=1 Tax=Anoxybacterium hadale TaxID=3408580 RepID=A0ACD1A9D4_9FIRM|nr:sensor histidine kinase [Clostridiales bacterium]
MGVYDIVRSLVTNAMLIGLLFSLARPKYRKWTLVTALMIIVTLDLALNIYFYRAGDYTTLAKLDILFFIIASAAVKPLFRETAMQWLFNCFTMMNVYAITVILSYYLSDLFPDSYYTITCIRVVIFGSVIALFQTRLRPLYRQASERWSIYLLVSAGLFLNFSWYFMAWDDVEQMMTQSFIPLLLLSMLTVLVYLANFLFLRRTLRESALREENMKMQSDRELTRHRLRLMEESVRQMSISQHDRRHFNNTLLTLLQRGEEEKAAELIRAQSEALPQKPRSYCQNVPVNAAVSYYAELARQQGIRCHLRLDIPEQLHVDELSLVMTVSNLMENAVNAVTLLPERQRELHFTAVNTGQLILEMANPCEEALTLDENGLPVPELHGHGRGSQSVADFVNSCGGELVYEVSNGQFRVRLMI